MTTFALNNLWNYLQGLSLSQSDREWLAYKLIMPNEPSYELTDEERNDFMADVVQTTRAMQKAFNPEKINYGAYSDKLSHLHFHLAPKYVDGPDYGGTFQMNPGKVYLTDAEYAEMIEKIKENL